MSNTEQFLSSAVVKGYGRTEYYKMLGKARKGKASLFKSAEAFM